MTEQLTVPENVTIPGGLAVALLQMLMDDPRVKAERALRHCLERDAQAAAPEQAAATEGEAA